MQTVWMAYLAAAAASSIPFLVAAWRGRGTSDIRFSRFESTASPIEPVQTGRQPLGDAAEAIHISLKRLAPVITNRSVRIDVAARPGLLVRMRGPVLADLMEELIAAVLHSAPASALLLTASPRGDRIYISLTDDVPGADPLLRQAMLRGVSERAALRGGALDVHVRPDEGTTVTLRVMAVFEVPAEDVSISQGTALSRVPAGH